MTAICLMLIAVAFAIACPLTAVLRRYAGRFGALDHPGHRKIHDRSIPATGGIAIFLALFTPVAAGLILAHTIPPDLWQRLLPGVVPHLSGIHQQTPLAAAFIATALVLHITGLIDDHWSLRPMLKLAAQLAAAAVLVIGFNVRLLDLDALRQHAGPWPSILLTLLWFTAITNAFNFLDNMDGLAAGVAAICAAVFLAAALLSGQWFVAALLALLLGAVLGFLIFNFPPASIFMGDGGSLVIGYTLALCAVRVTYYDPVTGANWWAVFTPLVVLAIPLYDLTSVTLIRLAQGRSPFVGDTQHFSHRLVRRGLSRRSAVLVIWAAALATALGGVMLGRLAAWQAMLIVVQTAAILLVLALLELTGRSADSSA